MNITKFSHKKRYTLVIIGILVLLVVGVGIMYGLVRKSALPMVTTDVNTNEPVASTETSNNKRIHVAAMGDMLAHDTIVANAKTSSGYDFGQYFTDVRNVTKKADAVFCNQEGLSSGASFGISGYPAFNAPTEFSSGLQSGAGCNIINLANNHMGDKGVAATNATIDNWVSLKPLAISGANKSIEDQSTNIGYATVKGIRIGFVSFADFNNNRATPPYSVNIYHDQALVKKLVNEARTNADVVMVSMHWGTEDSVTINADQKEQVTLLASLGVDVVIGTGPHVLQQVATVARPDGSSMVVWYSLGNMLSSQLNAPQLFSGIAEFDVIKADDTRLSIENLSFTPTYMHYEWTAAQQASGELMARTNAHVFLLKDAAEPLSRSQLHTTIDAQRNYISRTLGAEVTVND